jgi:predicted permease
MSGTLSLESLPQDLRQGIRRLVANPGFTAAVILSLALGIGANTAIFSLVNAIVLQPVPVGDPGRVVGIFGTDEEAFAATGLRYNPVSFPNYLDLRQGSRTLSGVAAYIWLPFSLSGSGPAEQVMGQMVTGNYFEVLGVKPALGRAFLPEEDGAPGAHPVVVLSHGLWRQRFGADPGLIGRTVRIDSYQFTVIGVAPPGFRGTTTLGAPALWVAMAMRQQVFSFYKYFDNRRWRMFELVGRLAPRVELEQARAAARSIGSRLEHAYPDENRKRGFAMLPLAQSGIYPNQRTFFVQTSALLLCASALVLLTACANVANLLLARATARGTEVAVRIALGASRRRLLRQLFTESLLIALLAGILGLLLAVWGKNLLWSIRPAFLPEDAIDLSLNPRALWFALALSLAAALLFGLAPALQTSRTEVLPDLQNRTGPARRARRLAPRNLLVVFQVAVSLVALIGAGLIVASQRNAAIVDTGFATKHLVAFGFDLGAQGYSEAAGRGFERRVVEAASSLPEVLAATVAQTRPLVPGIMRSLNVEGREGPQGGILVGVNAVSPEYFRALGIPLRQGREFSVLDRPGTLRVAIVNETMAKRLWPERGALGGRFRFAGEKEAIEVVGVARDSKYVFVQEEARPFVYLPLAQNYSPQADLIVRTRVPAVRMVERLRGTIQAVDPNLPLVGVEPLTQTIANTMWMSKLAAGLLVGFGLLALALAVLGLYSVLAYSVEQRRKEIGIRMALGAHRSNVLRVVLGQAMSFVGIGLAIGVATAAAASRLAESLLFGISGTDLGTYGGIALLLVGVALLASLVPAISAARTEPQTVLRQG